MAVVAALQFHDLPARSSSFYCERSEEWPRWIIFRDASNEDGWNAGLPISGKVKRLLKATQAEITQPSRARSRVPLLASIPRAQGGPRRPVSANHLPALGQP